MANEEEVKGTEIPAEKAEETVKEQVEEVKAADAPAEKAAEEKKEAPAAEAKTEPKAAEPKKEEAAAASEPVTRKIRTKSGKHIPVGVVHVKATFNNTQVTVTDPTGAAVAWSTAGRCGFKGSRKSTAYAATMVAQEAIRQAQNHGMHEVEVQVQGPGAGRESAVRAVQAAGMTVTAIKDVTPIPHNGCRAPKRRRV